MEDNIAVYAIFDLLEIIDQDAWEEYRWKVYERHGARVIASDDGARVLYGDWGGIRNVIIEFPDIDTVDRWYNSDEYKSLLEKRSRATRGDFVVVKGV